MFQKMINTLNFKLFCVLLLAQILYDNGPIFVPGTPPPNGFVTDGRAWNCRVISFMFINGTNDIAGDGEREPVRQAFQLWQQQAGLIFREVFNENEINYYNLNDSFIDDEEVSV
jgi:hypothetical protein